MVKAQPVLSRILPAMKSAVARPSRIAGDRYNQVSSIFFNAAHDALAGRTPPDAGLAAAAVSLNRLSHDGRW